MPRMTAVTDRVTWMEWDDRLRQMVHKTLRRGETGEVPDEVIARIESLRDKEFEDHRTGRVVDHRAGHVRLVPEDDYEEYISDAQVSSTPEAQFTDEQIQSWKTDDVIAHLNQTPALAERVLALEEERKTRRKAVLEFAQRVLDAQDGGDVSLTQGDNASEPLTPAEDA